MYDTFHASTLPETVPWFLLTSPSMKDPNGGHAPHNHHTVELITFVDYSHFEKWADFPSMKRSEDYERFKEQIGQRLVKAAERYIPGLSEHIKCIEYATPLSNEYWVNAVRGGCYGPEHTPDQMGPGRFSAFTSGIQGLFLVGAGTLAGGIMPCVASGVLAGGKAVRLLGLKS
jgi:all-trans-retinol 13,14-reductase